MSEAGDNSQQNDNPPSLNQENQNDTAKETSLPYFWGYLNEQDKESYLRIRAALASPACKHRRYYSIDLNREIINTIKNFVIRNDQDDWRRALVSGIVWFPQAIAINTRQLRLLLSKCKSSINALFQNLGYVTIPTTNEYSSSLIQYFPTLKDNFTELRKWTIRLLSPTRYQIPSQIPKGNPAIQAIQQLQNINNPPLNVNSNQNKTTTQNTDNDKDKSNSINQTKNSEQEKQLNSDETITNQNPKEVNVDAVPQTTNTKIE